MATAEPFIDLCCSSCQWAQTCDSNAVAGWLRTAERLRRDQEPELDVMHEILRAVAAELTCPDCAATSLFVQAAAETDVQWPEAPRCEGCGAAIPHERLEAVSNTTMCATCQSADDRGEGPIEQDYCPKCGAIMELQLSRGGGIARYVSKCTGNPACR